MRYKLVILCSALLKQIVVGENNAKTVLSSFLKDCYSDPRLVNRNNLPPMTLPSMLDILRKIEDHPGSIGDMRQISTGIVHMFRQDGIVYDPTAKGTENIVPYSPTGFPAYKNRMLLTKLIPNNQFNLPNDCVTPAEKCALHHMISSSLYLHTRGDEERTCDSITGRSERMTQYDKSHDVEIFNVNGIQDVRGRQIVSVSRCPLETGVVSTRWGDVAMGPVITGISAGLEEQNVAVTDLVAVRSGFHNSSIVVNNRYASTLSGDIAEVAIRQGTSRNTLTIGAKGGWNSTEGRRHYFLDRSDDLELTDAEIRGGLDGLVLSELGMAYANEFPELKLSQLLDMFYSNNGFKFHDSTFRACNRKGIVPAVAPRQTLIDQSIGPAIALYHVSSLTATTDMRGISNFINNTVDTFQNYIPQNINDQICNVTNDHVIRTKINLVLVADPTISRSEQIFYVVDNIDVGKFGSSVTLLHPESGEVLVEKTFSLTTFYQEFAKVVVAQTGTLETLRVLQSIRQLALQNLEDDHFNHYSGGNSTVALILTNNVPLDGAERVQAVQELDQLRRSIPDIRLIFATSSASEDAVSPLLQYRADFIPVALTSSQEPSMVLAPLLEHFKTVPRRIVNPLCGVQWANVNSGTVGFEDYVDADGINLYRLMPNYFYDYNTNRLLRIESTDYGPLSVCYSRTNTFPRRNRTTSVVPGDVTCESAANNGMVEINLAGACSSQGSTISSCPPLYVTVASTTVPATSQCKDFGCRYPNDVKYLVVAHELGCFSKAASLSHVMTVFLLCLTFIIKCY